MSSTVGSGMKYIPSFEHLTLHSSSENGMNGDLWWSMAPLQNYQNKAVVKESINHRSIQKAHTGAVAQVGESIHMTTISSTFHKPGLFGRVAQRSPLLKDRISCLQFYHKPYWRQSKHVEECALVRTWTFEPSKKLLVAEPVHHFVHTIPTMKQGGGSFMLCRCFNSAGSGKLVTDGLHTVWRSMSNSAKRNVSV